MCGHGLGEHESVRLAQPHLHRREVTHGVEHLTLRLREGPHRLTVRSEPEIIRLMLGAWRATTNAAVTPAQRSDQPRWPPIA